MEIKVQALYDVIQESEGNLRIPEIRVWCHPKNGGDDYYEVFKTFRDAFQFINHHPEAERIPLIAFKGWEIDLYSVQSHRE